MRYYPHMDKGLSKEQVRVRINEGLVNYDTSVPIKTIPQIILKNIFTLFNMLNLGLALAIFLVGSYKNLLFFGIVICNIAISIIQEIRSKYIVDKLSIITKTKARVIRDSKLEQISIDEIVLDDVLILRTGNQVVVDSHILSGEVEVNESFITGEAEPIHMKKGDLLKSGSFIIAGNCRVKVEHVGSDNYTSIISKGAKYIKPINSILLNSLKKVIKIIAIIIVPVGILLFINQYNLVGNSLENAVINTVAALVGIIPQGLILLTSTVLAVSVIKLSGLNVLVQELYCIEMLARVDVICLDKTGTITDGKMKVAGLIGLKTGWDFNKILGNIVNTLDCDNATMEALANQYTSLNDWKVIKKVPFSPTYKYSGVSFEEYGTFIIGAAEFIYKGKIKEVEELSKNHRVLLLCHSPYNFDNTKLPKDIKPLALITLNDIIRPAAIDTFNYFKEQGVDIKIISGDNIITVTEIAKRVGLEDIRGIDVSTLSEDELKEAVNKYNIFGRVKPTEKKDMVKYLQAKGHVVAMTGDGVNDVLALKEADCSIALGDCSDAARNVSQLVLLDSDFDAIPNIVNEGRRTINNIGRSASLFLSKTGYSLLLAFIFVFVNMPYPFQPIQLTLTSVFTIGVPAFILALESNKERIKGHFLMNVLSNALPAALTITANIIVIGFFGRFLNIYQDQISTLSLLMSAFTGFLLLIRISYPFNRLRIGLLIFLIIGFTLFFAGLPDFFSLTVLGNYMIILMIVLFFITIVIFRLMSKLVDKVIEKHPKFFM